jgi:hypothetical protein
MIRLHTSNAAWYLRAVKPETAEKFKRLFALSNNVRSPGGAHASGSLLVMARAIGRSCCSAVIGSQSSMLIKTRSKMSLASAGLAAAIHQIVP